jgi:hypothetical protein
MVAHAGRYSNHLNQLERLLIARDRRSIAMNLLDLAAWFPIDRASPSVDPVVG